MWAFFLYRMLYDPVQGLAQHLTNPHFDEEEFSRLHCQNSIRRLTRVP